MKSQETGARFLIAVRNSGTHVDTRPVLYPLFSKQALTMGLSRGLSYLDLLFYAFETMISGESQVVSHGEDCQVQ